MILSVQQKPKDLLTDKKNRLKKSRNGSELSDRNGIRDDGPALLDHSTTIPDCFRLSKKPRTSCSAVS